MELLRVILNYEFYSQNKYRLLKEFFPNSLYNLYKLICDTHEKYQRDITVDELKALYRQHHPTATVAQIQNINKLLDELPEIGLDVAQEVLEKAWFIEYGRQITQSGIDIVNGKSASFAQTKALISKIEQGELSVRDDLQPVSSEIEDIIGAIDTNTKWKFNIRSLETVASGIGPGIFTIIFARVETGKTALWVSLCASPGGFADQGALIHCYVNEEAAQRTQGRAIMAYTGMPLMEILLKKEEAATEYRKIRDKIKFFECRGKSIDEIEDHIDQHQPDIAVIDQLDKLSISGTFMRRDESLGALYARARAINPDKTAVIAISQANADSEGKTYMSSVNLAEARTSKAAEGDLVIGVGKSAIHTELTRILNIIKNKVTGAHNEVVTILHPEISRYTE